MRRFALAGLILLTAATGTLAASGRHALVASEHRLASQAGIEILRQGGNAIDAAVATALAAGVVNPSSCGIGGGGFMLVYDRGSKTVSALDYRETAPAAATREMFVRDGRAVPELSRTGGLAVGVPGEIAGLVAALHRYGNLSLRTVATPAITYARDGFPIGTHLAGAIAKNTDRIRGRPEFAALFLNEQKEPLRAGQLLRQRDLAQTLEIVAADGPGTFYGGPIGEAITSSVGTAGGILQRSDLVQYRPVWREPVQARFRTHEVFSMPPPSSGGGVLIQLLNILQRDDLGALGHNSPTYLHLLAEAMQFGFADRAVYYADPDFVQVPLYLLLSSDRASRLRRRLSAARTFPADFYGSLVQNETDGGTSHISVIDSQGNAVACTTTINTAFGSMLMAKGTGVILNNEMDDFSAQPGTPNMFGLVGNEANAVAPGKRPLSSMTPTILIRENEAVAVVGASGGPTIITAILQTLLNVLVFGNGATAAVTAPRIHHQWIPTTLAVEAGVPRPTRRVLELRTADGSLEGAADPRKHGEAIGW